MFYNEKKSMRKCCFLYNDVFVEQLVKHKLRPKNILIKVLAIVVAVIITLTIWLIVPTYSYIIFTAAVLLAYVVFRSQDYEFEYIFTNGDLDVDRIVSQRRRKRVMSTDCRSINVMAPYTPENEHLTKKYDIVRTVDYSSAPKAEGRWFFIFTGGSGAQVMVIFEPGKRLLEAMKHELKDKVKE